MYIKQPQGPGSMWKGFWVVKVTAGANGIQCVGGGGTDAPLDAALPPTGVTKNQPLPALFPPALNTASMFLGSTGSFFKC